MVPTCVLLWLTVAAGQAQTQGRIEACHLQVTACESSVRVQGFWRLEPEGLSEMVLEAHGTKGVRVSLGAAAEASWTAEKVSVWNLSGPTTVEVEAELPWRHGRAELRLGQEFPIENVMVTADAPSVQITAEGIGEIARQGGQRIYAGGPIVAGQDVSLVLRRAVAWSDRLAQIVVLLSLAAIVVLVAASLVRRRSDRRR